MCIRDSLYTHAASGYRNVSEIMCEIFPRKKGAIDRQLSICPCWRKERRMRIRSRAAVLVVLVALILTVAAPQVLGAPSFSDVQVGHIFYQEIMNLAGRNIVVGY